MKHLLIAIFFVACAPQNLAIQRVDEAVQPAFDQLQAELRELTGYDFLHMEKDGVEILADTARIEEYSATKTKAVAFYARATKEVVMPFPNEYVKYDGGKNAFMPSEAYYVVVLAHEIGHAMGLDHSPTGLMEAGGGDECLHRAGACLLEALSAEDRVMLR